MSFRRFLPLTLSAAVILLFAAFLALSPRNLHDLAVYKTAAGDWARGHPVYDRFMTTRDATGGEFAYPPLFLLAFLPFSKLPPDALVITWDMINFMFLFFSVLLLGKVFLAGKNFATYLGIFAFSLFSYPVLFTFHLGQTGIWVLFALSASLMLIHRKHEAAAPFPLVLISSLKLYPLFFSLIFLKPWSKTAWRIFAVFITACAIFTFLLFPDETKIFVRDVLPRRITPPLFPANQSIDAFVGRLFTGDARLHPAVPSPAAAMLLSTVLKLSGAACFLFFLFQARCSADDALVFLILFFLLFSPVVWTHYYVLLIPVCFWLLKNKNLFSGLHRKIISSSFVFLYLPATRYPAEWFPPPLYNILVSLPMFCVALQFGFVLSYLTKQTRGADILPE